MEYKEIIDLYFTNIDKYHDQLKIDIINKIKYFKINGKYFNPNNRNNDKKYYDDCDYWYCITSSDSIINKLDAGSFLSRFQSIKHKTIYAKAIDHVIIGKYQYNEDNIFYCVITCFLNENPNWSANFICSRNDWYINTIYIYNKYKEAKFLYKTLINNKYSVG